MRNIFYKYNCSGNTFIVVKYEENINYREFAKSICSKTTGACSDGLIVIKDDINEIATTMVKGNSKYYLQQFRNKVTNDAAYHNYMPHKPDYVLSTAHMVEANIGMCGVRGIN